jgi:PPOX class probable F420-dependent enzyme
MTAIPASLRAIIESGPLTHLTTLNADGSAQVSVVWIHLDGDDLLTAHMGHYAKVRNVERDPRTVLSFLAPSPPGTFLEHHAVLTARATAEPSDAAWDLLDRMTKVYLGPDETFPAPKGPGFVIRHTIEKVGGVGPWVQTGA